MSATNQTTFYKLPLFIATDKPSWMYDWNTAMQKLDAAIKAASQSGSSSGGATETQIQQAITQAQTALNTANQLQSQVTQNQRDINSHFQSLADLKTSQTQIEANVSGLTRDVVTLTNAVKQNEAAIISATSIANSADSKASTAKSDASSALSKATTAQSTASSAQTTANEAKTKNATQDTQISANSTAITNLQRDMANLNSNKSVLGIFLTFPSNDPGAPTMWVKASRISTLVQNLSNEILSEDAILIEFIGSRIVTKDNNVIRTVLDLQNLGIDYFKSISASLSVVTYYNTPNNYSRITGSMSGTAMGRADLSFTFPSASNTSVDSISPIILKIQGDNLIQVGN